MATPKTEAQISIGEKFIEDAELAEAIETLLEHEESHREYVKAKQAINGRVALFAETVQDGQRVRCGNYVFEMKERAGGGFTVPTWEKRIPSGFSDGTAGE